MEVMTSDNKECAGYLLFPEIHELVSYVSMITCD